MNASSSLLPRVAALCFALAAVGANAQTIDTTPYRLDVSPGTYVKRFSSSAGDSSRVASATNRLGQAMIALTTLDGSYAGEVEFYGSPLFSVEWLVVCGHDA